MSSTCPACGHPIVDGFAPQHSNRLPTTTLEIPEHLVSAVSKALMIGGNTAMMSRLREAQDFLHGAANSLSSEIPWAAQIFSPETWGIVADRLINSGDITFDAVNVGSTWSAEWKISATAETDPDWPRSGRRRAPLFSEPLENEAAALDYLERFREEALRLCPV